MEIMQKIFRVVVGIGFCGAVAMYMQHAVSPDFEGGMGLFAFIGAWRLERLLYKLSR